MFLRGFGWLIGLKTFTWTDLSWTAKSSQGLVGSSVMLCVWHDGVIFSSPQGTGNTTAHRLIMHRTICEADCSLQHSVSHRALKAPMGQQINLPWVRGTVGQVAFKLGLQLQTFQFSTVTDLGLELQYCVSLGLQLTASTSAFWLVGPCP